MTSTLLEHHRAEGGVRVGFTSVETGNLALHLEGQSTDSLEQARANRARLEQSLGLSVGSTAYLHQVHSADVVDAQGRGWRGGTVTGPTRADAMVSRAGSTPLAIMVADCLPVVFATDDGDTAVAHAGRVGLTSGVLENTLDQLGADPATVCAWIGPAICGSCYEVPAAMRDDIGVNHPAAMSTTCWGTPALDLPAAAEALLVARGVRVHRSQVCTYEDERVYSHRRAPGQGRFAGVIWRSDTPA
ncbi:MAG: polyphenol oxidase family protein [Micrococcaceae bacterium]